MGKEDLRARITEATLPLTPENVQGMIEQFTRDDVDLILHYHADEDDDTGARDEEMCQEVWMPDHVRLVLIHGLELIIQKLTRERKLPQ